MMMDSITHVEERKRIEALAMCQRGRHLVGESASDGVIDWLFGWLVVSLYICAWEQSKCVCACVHVRACVYACMCVRACHRALIVHLKYLHLVAQHDRIAANTLHTYAHTNTQHYTPSTIHLIPHAIPTLISGYRIHFAWVFWLQLTWRQLGST